MSTAVFSKKMHRLHSGVQDRFQMTREQVVDAICASNDKNWIAQALLPDALQHYRSELTRKFVRQYPYVVQSGLFNGMLLPDQIAWGDGDQLPKLLGCYEAELESPIGNLLKSGYSTIINIGCAEGYYAVGIARLLAQAQVFAFDINQRAQEVCALAAQMNGVSDRIQVAGRCSPQILSQILRSTGRALLILDCEGDELRLLMPDRVLGLHSADIVVECHDFVDPVITSSLIERFSPTHCVQQINEGDRPRSVHPFLKTLTTFEEALATCEFRPERMHWLVLTGRQIAQ